MINKNIEGHIVCWSFSHTKNILRIYEADICQKVKNTEAQTKKHYSYKKKACNSYWHRRPAALSSLLLHGNLSSQFMSSDT